MIRVTSISNYMGKQVHARLFSDTKSEVSTT